MKLHSPRPRQEWRGALLASVLSGALAVAVAALPARGERLGVGRIAFLRSGGEIWRTGPDKGSPQRLPRAGGFDQVASDGARLAAMKDGQVYVLEGPGWAPRKVTRKGLYTGRPYWPAGTSELFVARLRTTDGHDDGVWRINSRRASETRFLAATDANLSVNEKIVASPDASEIASGGLLTRHLYVQITNRASRKTVRQPLKDGLLGGVDFAWLDNRSLLIAGSPAKMAGGCGGIRRLDLVSAKLQPWMYGDATDVTQIERSPFGTNFVVGKGWVDGGAALPVLARELVLVSSRAREERVLFREGPCHAFGFSPDGRWLLVGALPKGSDSGKGLRLSVVRLSDGAARGVADDVTEAVWLSGNQ